MTRIAGAGVALVAATLAAIALFPGAERLDAMRQTLPAAVLAMPTPEFVLEAVAPALVILVASNPMFSRTVSKLPARSCLITGSASVDFARPTACVEAWIAPDMLCRPPRFICYGRASEGE